MTVGSDSPHFTSTMWWRGGPTAHILKQTRKEGMRTVLVTLLFVLMKEGLVADHSLKAQFFMAGKV